MRVWPSGASYGFGVLAKGAQRGVKARARMLSFARRAKASARRVCFARLAMPTEGSRTTLDRQR